MVKITVLDSSNTEVRLRVEGRITGPGVEELQQSCDLQALNEGVRLTLDLADVSFADQKGIDLLKKLKSRGVVFLNLAPFMAMQLLDRKSPGWPIRNKRNDSDERG